MNYIYIYIFACKLYFAMYAIQNQNKSIYLQLYNTFIKSAILLNLNCHGLNETQ